MYDDDRDYHFWARYDDIRERFAGTEVDDYNEHDEEATPVPPVDEPPNLCQFPGCTRPAHRDGRCKDHTPDEDDILF